MADWKDLLERERERFDMPIDAFDRLVRRRARQQRERRLTAGIVALIVTVAGVGGGLWALREGSRAGDPGADPSVTVVHTPTASPTLSSSPGTVPTLALPPAVAGTIQFVDDLIGWMVGANGEIMSTSDGGHSWSSIHDGPPAALAVDFLDLQHGWALAEGGLIRTTDGGASWEDLGPPALRTVQFLTPDVGWGVEKVSEYPEGLGLLVSTKDGGQTWDRQLLEVNSVCFAENVLGYAAGPSEGGLALFRTDDGGATWAEATIPTPGGDAAMGWRATVRCAGGAWVLGTADGAAGHLAYAVWRTIETGPSAEPVLQEAATHPLGEGLGIPEALNPYPGPMVAFDGAMLYMGTWCPQCGGDLPFASLERSDDSDLGTTWTHPTIVGSDRPAEPLGLSFLDPNHGWVLLHEFATDSRVVLTTTDGGQTWTEP